jgi:hypothetical protein
MMSDTLKKLLVVVSLTLLIWAWAYMSQEKPGEFIGTLQVADSTDPSLLVTFSLAGSRPQTKIPLTSITLKGAPSKLSELQKRHQLSLDFYYDPTEEGHTEGVYALKLLDYLQESTKIQELGLTLESCTPLEVTVTVEKLIEKELPIECRNENGSLITDVEITPDAFAKIYVRKGDNDPAIVKLTQQQIETARKQPVEVTPSVKLGEAGVERKAANPVQVRLRSEERLKPHTFQPTSFRFVMSPKIADGYKIELVDETFTDSTSFMATDEAMDAYKKMPYHILIEIRDEDSSLTEILPRPVIYNFPPKDFKNGDIDIVEIPIPKTATFKLTPINPEVN